MRHISRKAFLQTSAVLTAAALADLSFDTKKYKPLLSFSTLGCPDWSFPQIVDFAVLHGYKGLEIRGIKREMDLPKSDIFSPQNIGSTIQLMKDKGLRFVDLGSSCTLHFEEDTEREKNIAEGKRFIDLAQQINCPYIRVFPNLFPKGQDENLTILIITKNLHELGEYAKKKKVRVLMETHGDLVKTEDLEKIMRLTEHSNVGLIWDVSNMWTVTKEPPKEVYNKLKKYIYHTHIKDAKLVDGKPQYTLLGEGEVPIFEAIDALSEGQYKGYYSFEWEKLWHPEIAEPEIAFAQYSKTMIQHFK